ncbi:nucleotidyltransferase family protein [Streptomyces sp. NPDC007851]|uniref:nucleotidyltransferase family protein n=1 Tax=Streptomyces sp. NPDC007851 TaxID=3155008 RepID=UPI0033C5EB06
MRSVRTVSKTVRRYRTAQLGLPGWYLTAGCLFQAVWNVATDRHPTSGIKDYDVFCFDNHDLSWEAEDAVIKAADAAFAGLPAQVEVRNEARVHLWYEQKFGVACAPYASTEAAIDSFTATACCLGARLERDGQWRVYPNPVLAPRAVYETKTARW